MRARARPLEAPSGSRGGAFASSARARAVPVSRARVATSEKMNRLDTSELYPRTRAALRDASSDRDRDGYERDRDETFFELDGAFARLGRRRAGDGGVGLRPGGDLGRGAGG